MMWVAAAILALGHPVTMFAAYAACSAIGLNFNVPTNVYQVFWPAYLLFLLAFAWGRWRWFRYRVGSVDCPRVLNGFCIANLPAFLGLPLTVAFGLPVEGNVAGFILYPALALAILVIVPSVWFLSGWQIRRIKAATIPMAL